MTKIKLKKIDIYRNLNTSTGFSILYSKKVIDNLIVTLSECIKENKLIIKNIGNFKIINKKKRIGRNPKTKQEFIINERKSISFTASKNLIKKINF